MTIVELAASLDAELGFVRTRMGSIADWEEVTARYGLPAPAAAPTHPEQHAVLSHIIVAHARALEQIAPASPPALVRSLWDRLAREAAAAATPPKPRSKFLGNLFVNATASVNDGPFAHIRWDSRIVVLCKNCGAPQERPREGRCSYCSGELFQRSEEEEEST
jgi:hypothetical protein